MSRPDSSQSMPGFFNSLLMPDDLFILDCRRIGQTTPDNGAIQPPSIYLVWDVPEGTNRYGEDKTKKIVGVRVSDELCVTRIHQWEIIRSDVPRASMHQLTDGAQSARRAACALEFCQ